MDDQNSRLALDLSVFRDQLMLSVFRAAYCGFIAWDERIVLPADLFLYCFSYHTLVPLLNRLTLINFNCPRKCHCQHAETTNVSIDCTVVMICSWSKGSQHTWVHFQYTCLLHSPSSAFLLCHLHFTCLFGSWFVRIVIYLFIYFCLYYVCIFLFLLPG